MTFFVAAPGNAATYSKDGDTVWKTVENPNRVIGSDRVSQRYIEDGCDKTRMRSAGQYDDFRMIETRINGETDNRRRPTPGEEKLFENVVMVQPESHEASPLSGFITGANCDILVTSDHSFIKSPKGKLYPHGRLLTDSAYALRDLGRLDEVIKGVTFASGYELSKKSLRDRTFRNRAKDFSDWRVLVLEKPDKSNCMKVPLQFDKQRDFSGRPAAIMGYQDSRSGQFEKLIDPLCEVQDYIEAPKEGYSDFIEVSCDTDNGASGAPLIAVNDDRKPVILGINKGAITADGTAILTFTGKFGEKLKEALEFSKNRVR